MGEETQEQNSEWLEETAVPNIWYGLQRAAFGFFTEGVASCGGDDGLYITHALEGPLVASGTSKGWSEMGVGERLEVPHPFRNKIYGVGRWAPEQLSQLST